MGQSFLKDKMLSHYSFPSSLGSLSLSLSPLSLCVSVVSLGTGVWAECPEGLVPEGLQVTFTSYDTLLGYTWLGLSFHTASRPSFGLQIPFVVLCDSWLRVFHGYKHYAKLDSGETRKTMVPHESGICTALYWGSFCLQPQRLSVFSKCLWVFISQTCVNPYSHAKIFMTHHNVEIVRTWNPFQECPLPCCWSWCSGQFQQLWLVGNFRVTQCKKS